MLLFAIGSENYTVNGVTQTMDVTPTILKARTMLPLRFVTENLGCGVEWDQDTQKVTITKADFQPASA